MAADELTAAESQAFSELSEDLDTLSSGVSQKLDTLSTDLSQKLDTLSTDLSQKMDGVNDGVGGVRDALTAANADSVDYSTTLQQIGQLMAVTDILLIILCVMMFLACGLLVGFHVTKWLRDA